MESLNLCLLSDKTLVYPEQIYIMLTTFGDGLNTLIRGKKEVRMHRDTISDKLKFPQPSNKSLRTTQFRPPTAPTTLTLSCKRLLVGENAAEILSNINSSEHFIFCERIC